MKEKIVNFADENWLILVGVFVILLCLFLLIFDVNIFSPFWLFINLMRRKKNTK